MRLFKKVFTKDFGDIPVILYDIEDYSQTPVKFQRKMFWELDIKREYKLICRNSIYFIKYGNPIPQYISKVLKA